MPLTYGEKEGCINMQNFQFWILNDKKDSFKKDFPITDSVIVMLLLQTP
jgi:hypothetical protein